LERDTKTFLSVIESNKGIIYKVANSYCRNGENKKDLIQEIILQLWLSFNKYDEGYKLSTWMYRIALNVSISFYRKENRRSEINHPLSENILWLNEDNSGSRNADLDHLHRFIKELKEIDRAIMILYLEGTSQQEIGKILGLTMTNVSTKVSRIKQQLQQNFSNIKT
jgi:RNA polymerase sigma-70 factor (ECF subfamily)